MNKLSQTTLEQLHSRALACVNALFLRIPFGTPPTDDWDQAREAIDALPLCTEVAATAHNRLNNARAYSDADERGAARYELRLLTKGLKNR